MQFYINLNLTIICTISVSVLTISNKKIHASHDKIHAIGPLFTMIC